MRTNPVNWFEIYVQDMERARTFYETVLQTQLERLPSPEIEMWAFPMDRAAGGSAGSLIKYEGFPSGGNSVLVYFSCEDCAVEEQRAVEAGGRVQRSKTDIGQWGFISLVYDSEGNMIGLHSTK